MNTRIQVEHPVTELVTGIDLVQWQIRVAAGERLPFAQSDIRMEGHAIECRITSEDPANGFLPSTGRIERVHVPAGPGVRWDGGIVPGFEVGLHYDPMLAKLIVHAPDRALAIERMERALRELRIAGVETSAPFHARVMREPDFRAGRIDIRYLETHEAELLRPALDDQTLRTAALAAALLEERSRDRPTTAPSAAAPGTGRSAWTGRGSWNGR
jgi:acetyl-CoA carboxylase biotin carboxylase subunit